MQLCCFEILSSLKMKQSKLFETYTHSCTHGHARLKASIHFQAYIQNTNLHISSVKYWMHSLLPFGAVGHRNLPVSYKHGPVQLQPHGPSRKAGLPLQLTAQPWRSNGMLSGTDLRLPRNQNMHDYINSFEITWKS